MKGFYLLRQDRTEGFLKGGVAMYLREDLVGDMTTISSGSNDVVEWLIIYLERKNMVFGCLYRPPSCQGNKFQEALKSVNDAIDKLGCPSPTIVICGDFNLPIIQWENNSQILGGSLNVQAQAIMLNEFMNNQFYEQMVQENTRQSNILDLVLTNNPDMINSIGVRDTVLSDHRLLDVNLYYDQASTNSGYCKSKSVVAPQFPS